MKKNEGRRSQECREPSGYISILSAKKRNKILVVVKYEGNVEGVVHSGGWGLALSIEKP